MANKWVYLFQEVDEANAHAGGDWEEVRALLGGKGANLAEMVRIGVPVPPGFTVTTEACNAYLAADKAFPEGLWDEVLENLKQIEKESGKAFGDASAPLLVSCRSGAKFSMPGMMDTVLNLGLNESTLEGLARKAEDRRFALDCYRRLIHMFGDVVMAVPKKKFEKILRSEKEKNNITYDFQIPESVLEKVIDSYKTLIKKV